MDQIIANVGAQWGALGLLVVLVSMVIRVLYLENASLRERNIQLTERVIIVAETSKTAIERWTAVEQRRRR